jgi:small subunit ribosomal protein S4
LIEKQKLRFYYGISERQLVRYVKKARNSKEPTGELLLKNLEQRLDNIVYRLGWAPTILAARQLVNHGHILVNTRRVTIPSYLCTSRESIAVKNTRRSRDLVNKNLQQCIQKLPSYLSLNIEILTASVVEKEDRYETLLDLNKLLVIEYYSNRLLSNNI